MAYESTEVPVSRSQEGIRKLIMSRKGGKVAFISDPPAEGFEAEVQIDGLPYRVRLMGQCRPAPETKATAYRRAKETTDKFREDWRTKEERRIWRVIFYHLKSVFEAADSGVMEFRELMLPYLVTENGETIAQRLVPNLPSVIMGNPARMLAAGKD